MEPGGDLASSPEGNEIADSRRARVLLSLCRPVFFTVNKPEAEKGENIRLRRAGTTSSSHKGSWAITEVGRVGLRGKV